MKKIVLIIFLVVALFSLLAYSGVLNSLLIFLIIGAVPGTGLDLSPNHMLIIIAAIVWVLVSHFAMTKLASVNKKPNRL